MPLHATPPAAGDLDFDCTICGRCCRDLRLPLTVAEAVAWLEDGHEVQILCEAIPWPREPDEDDGPAAHKRRRSFAALSGELPIRVVAILAAPFPGPCPNLQPDLHCAIYAQRPLVCRIYPAEINPFVALDPGAKGCPPEAWAPGRAPLLRGGVVADATTQALIDRSRAADAADAPTKARLCAALGIDAAALANEGFMVHTPQRADLLQALRAAMKSEDDAPPAPWRLVSNRRDTLATLASVGAACQPHPVSAAEYLGFLPADI